MPSMPEGIIIIIAVIAAVLIACILARLYVNYAFRCPECKRRRAQEETGKTGKGRWIQAEFRFETQHEWQCKYCGYREWVEEQSD